MWVYIRSEPQLWTVGFYSPDGVFNADSDHTDRAEAAKRAAYLNGSRQDEVDALHEVVEDLRIKISELKDDYNDFRSHYNLL